MQDLCNHVTIVVVPQSTGKLLVVHRRLALAISPQPSYSLGISELELTIIANPLDDIAECSVS